MGATVQYQHQWTPDFHEDGAVICWWCGYAPSKAPDECAERRHWQSDPDPTPRAEGVGR